jgi:ankyrin repeat protein
MKGSQIFVYGGMCICLLILSYFAGGKNAGSDQLQPQVKSLLTELSKLNQAYGREMDQHQRLKKKFADVELLFDLEKKSYERDRVAWGEEKTELLAAASNVTLSKADLKGGEQKKEAMEVRDLKKNLTALKAEKDQLLAKAQKRSAELGQVRAKLEKLEGFVDELKGLSRRASDQKNKYKRFRQKFGDLLSVSKDVSDEDLGWKALSSTMFMDMTGLGGRKDWLTLSLLGPDTLKEVDGVGESFLHRCVRTSHHDFLTWALANGADLSHRNDVGETPAFLAAKLNHLSTLDLLHGHHAELFTRNAEGDMDIHEVAKRGHTKVFKWLLEKGGSVSALNAHGETPLMLASRKGKISILKSVENLSDYAQERDSNGWTALHHAVADEQVEIATLLLRYGWDVNQPDARGYSPLQLAVAAKRVSMVKLFVREGAILMTKDGDQRTLLHTAVTVDSRDLLLYLLESGLPPLSYDRLERTPLHLAVSKGSIEMAQLLLSWGADAEVMDLSGRSSVALARELDHRGLLELFGED